MLQWARRRPTYVLGQAWPSTYHLPVRVNVGQAKTELSKLLARVEAGEDVEIARNGVPGASLVRIEPQRTAREVWQAMDGALAGQIWIADDFEWTDEEIEELFYSD